MIYWKYTYSSGNYDIWERDPETKRERMIYDDGYCCGKWSWHTWHTWDTDDTSKEEAACNCKITVLTREQVFVEML